MLLYPSPAQNNLRVQFASEIESTVKMNVYNIAGEKMILQEGASVIGQNILNVSTSSVQSGEYIFEIEASGSIKHQQFIIAHYSKLILKKPLFKPGVAF